MKIIKPFSDLPLWEFYDVDIPHIDYDSFDFKTIKELNADNPCLQDDIYTTRHKCKPFGDPSYEKLVKNVHNVINNIKESEGSPNIIMLDESLLFSMGAWSFEKNDIDIIIDQQGYFMGYHLDNRNVKANLFLNLEDNESSTEFFITNTFQPDNFDNFIPTKTEWTGPTKKGSGYFYFNNSNFWHKIDVTEKERKILMMGIYVN